MNSYLKYALELIKQKGPRAALNPANAIEEFVVAKKFQQNQELLSQMDFNQKNLQENKAVMDTFHTLGRFEPKTVNWFMPTFEHPFGGVYTILRFAQYFQSQKGIKNTFVICGTEKDSTENIRKAIAKAFPNIAPSNILILTDNNLEKVPDADISIASYWITAYKLLKFNRTKGKFYFIQDYEPLFFPAGFTHGLAEASYRFGFHAIINTPGLYHEYVSKHGGIAEYFMPSIDKEVFHPSPAKKPQGPFKIIYYARPNNPRNGFELGLMALKKVKQQYCQNVEIYAAGSKWSSNTYDPKRELVNLGVLPYQETGELYRKCDLGVVFMFTKHPSYLPFELMACGCPVLTNRNPATTWLLKDNENCALTEPTVSSIHERISELIENRNLLEKMALNGLKTSQQTDWQVETEKIYQFISNNKKPGNT